MGFEKIIIPEMEEKKKEYLSHCRQELIDLANREKKITLEEIQELQCNGYEWSLLVRNFDSEALLDRLTYAYNQSSFDKCLVPYDKPPISYNEAVIQELLPLYLESLGKYVK